MEPPEPRWSREDVQRVLFHVVKRYEAAVSVHGQIDELLTSAIYDVAVPTLKDNHWWPEDDKIAPTS